MKLAFKQYQFIRYQFLVLLLEFSELPDVAVKHHYWGPDKKKSVTDSELLFLFLQAGLRRKVLTVGH